MTHISLDAINKKTDFFGNMRSFTCKYSKYSISSISLVLAGLMERAMQSGSAAEARHTTQLVKSITEVTKTSPECKLSTQP